MKSDIHPDYHTVKILMDRRHRIHHPDHLGQGRRHRSISTSTPKSHPAWTGGTQQLLDRGGRLSRFQKKFSGLGLKKYYSQSARRTQKPPRVGGFLFCGKVGALRGTHLNSGERTYDRFRSNAALSSPI